MSQKGSTVKAKRDKTKYCLLAAPFWRSASVDEQHLAKIFKSKMDALTVLYFRHRLNHSVFKVLSESIGSFLLQFLSCVSWVSFNSLLMVVRSQFPGLFPFFRQRHTELLLWGTFLTAFATLREAFLILKKTKALLLQLPFVIQTFTKSESNSIPFGARSNKRKE